MNRVYLVKHGLSSADSVRAAPDWRRRTLLTEEGSFHAIRTARYFAHIPIDEILSSPAASARETARLIGAASSLPVIVDQRLRGIDVGSLVRSRPTEESLSSYASVLAEWVSGQTNRGFLGGEDFKSVWSRTRAVIEEIAHNGDGRNVIVVGHGDVFTVTLPQLCLDAAALHLVSNVPGSCSIAEILLERSGTQFEATMVSWASQKHLQDPSSETRSTLTPLRLKPAYARA
jgi:broad specificity phosphatase PhoE